MTDERDLYSVQHIVPDDLADRLLAGTAVGSDLDGGLSQVAMLLRAARTPASGEELAGERAAAAAFASVVRSARSNSAARGPERVLRRFPTKGVTVVVAATMLSAGVAAAATGNLPTGVQRAVSHSLSRVGVEVPSPDDSKPHVVSITPAGTTNGAENQLGSNQDGGSSSAGTATTPGGVGVSNATREELCTAYRTTVQARRGGTNATKPKSGSKGSKAGGSQPGATAVAPVFTPAMFQALADEASRAGQSIDQLCGLAGPDGTPTTITSNGPLGPSSPQPSAQDPGRDHGESSDSGHDRSPSSSAASQNPPPGPRPQPSNPSPGPGDSSRPRSGGQVTRSGLAPTSPTASTAAPRSTSTTAIDAPTTTVKP